MTQNENAVDQLIHEMVKTAIDLKRDAAFVPEYAPWASESEVLGVILAQYFRWSGRQIAETAYAALEEGNFHTESHRFNEVWRAANQDQDDLWVSEKDD